MKLDEAIEKLTGICGIAVSDETLIHPREDGDMLCQHTESLQSILTALQDAKVARDLLQELHDHSTAYPSAIEIDAYDGGNLNGDEWMKRAKALLAAK